MTAIRKRSPKRRTGGWRAPPKIRRLLALALTKTSLAFYVRAWPHYEVFTPIGFVVIQDLTKILELEVFFDDEKCRVCHRRHYMTFTFLKSDITRIIRQRFFTHRPKPFGRAGTVSRFFRSDQSRMIDTAIRGLESIPDAPIEMTLVVPSLSPSSIPSDGPSAVPSAVPS
jgi:hypothetical protein